MNAKDLRENLLGAVGCFVVIPLMLLLASLVVYVVVRSI